MATAASRAFPPEASTASPAAVARWCGEATHAEGKMEAERRRLLDGSVANPKEPQAIEAEVRNLESRKAHAEDLVLEQMERGEELHVRLGPIEADEAEARQRVANLEEGSARELV